MMLFRVVLIFAIMNAIFTRVTQDEKKQIRKLETKGKALIRTNAAVLFNQMCIDNNLLPKFTKTVSAPEYRDGALYPGGGLAPCYPI